jgi:hypothetical protein
MELIHQSDLFAPPQQAQCANSATASLFGEKRNDAGDVRECDSSFS